MIRRFLIAATIFTIIIIITWQHRAPSLFNEKQWSFQKDLRGYKLPDILQYADLPPLNPSKYTFATLYASRDATMRNPYFLATQQGIYRLIWLTRSRYQVTVFVPPYVSLKQRQYFAAAGAAVREVPLVPFTPDKMGTAGRLRDMFTKLEMWRQTDFTKIAYMDSDTFALENVDDIFDIAITQHSELEPHEYVFAGHNDKQSLNAGVMVLSPNEIMYDRLIAESRNQSNFDVGTMEQALLNYVYSPDGPFPWSDIPVAYNGVADIKDEGERLAILHTKLWDTEWIWQDVWYKTLFKDTWKEMLEFYQSEDFRRARMSTNN